MKLKQIEKKYPKAHNEFMIYCESQNLSPANWMDVRDLWKEVTDFFDKKKMYIGIEGYKGKPNDNFCSFYSTVINGKYKIVIVEKLRKQAESKAIEAAFKILEDRLQEETK